MALASLQSHSLPGAILERADIPDARSLMRVAQDALNELEEQITVFELVKVFEDNPKLIAFNYDLNSESDDEGGSYYYASVSVNSEATGDDADGEGEDDEDDDLRETVSDWINGQSEDWMSSLEGHTIRRPEGAQSLLEGLMSQCLSAESFASWQASSLEAVANSAPRSAPKAI